MANLFNSIQLQRPKNNVFDLTHDVKLSFNMGELIPVMCTEAVPGDKFTISHESLLRFAPMVAPVMHRSHATLHTFFVPNRIMYSGWEGFITGESSEQFPFITINEENYTPLMDYLGIPRPLPGESERVSVLPFVAYQMVWEEYYRDQNLIPAYDWVAGGGEYGILPDGIATLRRRAWEHDYFTAALPFAQAGAAVEIPLGEVTLKDDWSADGAEPVFRDDDGDIIIGAVNNATGGENGIHIGAGTDDMAYDPDGSLEVAPTTINDLRRAFRLQEWLEKSARGGRRYVEKIFAHFGVKSPDARLQRPEYITGVKTPITISEIVNTTGTTELPQGNMAGHGLGVVNGRPGSYRCTEHGYFITIMSVMPQTAYQQGIPKHFLKTSDPYQYFWPEFANIGEQEVLNKEVYAFQGDAGNSVFGYVPRYAEYKFEQNRVAGDFRTTLDFWHMGRKFATPPALNRTFIECNPDDRIFAVTDPTEHKLYCHVLNKVRAVRPMPKFGTPSF